MIWFYTRGSEIRTCETRLAADGEGYELIVTDSAGVHVETFTDMAQLLAREHEILSAWRALGWRDTGARVPRPRNAH